ncbi:hypothetical protein AVEN_195347-1 [Araneus ventricosus]|uniref:Uncharacterized protein n=1 Tax=Araneus ventricosus TaxID=182803 RepID=A0A4Y2DHQ0_ARAVE|nr:hypothetical protein AVEN_195347-1 [Araneus ventricosus]
MLKAILVTIFLRTAIHFLLVSESTFARSIPWKFVALDHFNNQGLHRLSNMDDDSRDEDTESMSDADTGLADFEMDDLAKRQDDDYGHMRFGRSNAYLNANHDHVFKKMRHIL